MIILLVIFPEDIELRHRSVHRDIYQSIIQPEKYWKQFKCPTRYIQVMKYYIAIKMMYLSIINNMRELSQCDVHYILQYYTNFVIVNLFAQKKMYKDFTETK